MNKKFSTGCVLAAWAVTLAATPAWSQTRHDDGGAYVSGGLALTRTGSLSEATQRALTNAGFTSTTSGSNRSTNFNLSAGYRFNRYLAGELTLENAGSVSASSAITAPAVGSYSMAWRSRGAGLSALGILPLTDDLSVFGRAGLTYWRTARSYSGTVVLGTNDRATNVSPTVGVGVSYALNADFDVTGELVRHTRVGADDVGSTGVTQGKVGLRLNLY